eukprot:scaffold2036_cov115-Isochrysis_galbana.AAC.1
MEDDKMITCEGPSGCKKYLPNLALDLKVPRCICHLKSSAQAENAAKSKVARKTATTLAKTHGVSTLHALLSANKAGNCPRFATGLCMPQQQKGRLVHGRPQPRGRVGRHPRRQTRVHHSVQAPPALQDSGRVPQRQKLRLPSQQVRRARPPSTTPHPHPNILTHFQLHPWLPR